MQEMDIFFLNLKESDERIKENIIEVNDTTALNKVRDICCWYEYIDKLGRGDERVIGFIAQQVMEHFPEAVKITSGFIPNEMKRLDMSGVSWDEIQVEEPNDPTSSDSGIKYKMTTDSLNDVSGVKYKFYVTNIDSNEPQKEILVTGDEDNSFLFENKWDRVFVMVKK